jgi:cupin fold WbuC family metalloprotein
MLPLKAAARINLRLIAPDVYAAQQPVGVFGLEECRLLLERLPQSRHGRVRINMHAEDSSSLHEMFIALAAGTYVRPHRHIGKSESFHIIHGQLDVVLFDDDGTPAKIIPLETGGTCFYRLSAAVFHTIMPRSEAVIIHEVTDGPFDPQLTIQATFAPPAEDADAVREYQIHLNELLKGRDLLL